MQIVNVIELSIVHFRDKGFNAPKMTKNTPKPEKKSKFLVIQNGF